MASSKKANGEGSVYKETKTGLWVAEISWKDHSGEMHRKRWRDKSQTEVKHKLKTFRRNLILSNGDYSDQPDVLFREYATFWLNEVLRPQLKPSSYMRKEVTLKNQVFPAIGDIPINMVSSANIRDMIKSMQKKGLSYSTIKKAYECVKGAMNDYIAKNTPLNTPIRFQNPCIGVALPRNTGQSETPMFFTKEQRDMIVAESTRCYSNGVPVYRMGWAFPLLLYTGMRKGEMLALTWDDVDFDAKTITISKSAATVKVQGHYTTITQNSTKTKYSKRIIPLNRQAIQALTELKKITGSEPYIICTKNHRQVDQSRITRCFHSILTKIGIMKDGLTYGVHTLRHTFASMLFQNGCEVKVVSEILGHSDTAITENIYIHVLQEQKVKAMANLDEFTE